MLKSFSSLTTKMFNSIILQHFESNKALKFEITAADKYVPWPADVTLYQPLEMLQILLPEFASCLAVRTYLNMCRLPYKIKYLANAEFMCSKGRLTKLPVLRIGNQVVAEFEPIVRCINALGHGLRHEFNEDEQHDMEALISYVENVFSLSELWSCFKDHINYKLITAPRIGVVYPWPLCFIQNKRKYSSAERLFEAYQWSDMHIYQVLKQMRSCCAVLTEKLLWQNDRHFFGAKPCELDALVFGHVFAILTITLPNMELAEILLKHKALIEFAKLFEKEQFQIN